MRFVLLKITNYKYGLYLNRKEAYLHCLVMYLDIHRAVERLSIRHEVNVHKVEVNIFEVAIRVFVVLLQALVAATRGNNCQALGRRAVHRLILVGDLQHVTVAFIIVTVRILRKNLAANSVKREA